MNTKTLGLVVTTPLLVFYGLKHNDEMRFPQLGILMKRYRNTPQNDALISAEPLQNLEKMEKEFELMKPCKMV